MASQSYLTAPPEYFTHFRRGGFGFQGALQGIYPAWLIKAKERYFSWAQSLFITNLLASVGLLNGKRMFDVAIIGSGLPFLEHELGKDKITAVSIDPNLNIANIVDKEFSLQKPIISDTTRLPLPDNSVSVAASHNYLQKAPSLEAAKRTVMEMLRVATDYAVVQVTPGDYALFRGDMTHRLALTTQQWNNLIEDAIKKYAADDWHISEIHTVKVADAVPVGRPPVFVLENGNHAETKRDFSSLRWSTRVALVAEEETTLANMISASRPPLAYFAIHGLEGALSSLAIGGVMALDAVDGMVARRLGPSKWGAHVDRISDHAVEAIAYFSLGFPVIGTITAARNAAVDSALLKGVVDEKETNRRSILSRGGYGIAKTATFMAAPLSHFTGEALAYASTAFSLCRALDLKKALHKILIAKHL